MRDTLLILSLIIVLVATIGFAKAETGTFGKISVPAVTNEEKGVFLEIEIEIIPGQGRILFNTEPFAGIQTQNSERVARTVAQNFTGVNLSNKDLIITFKVPAVS